MLISIHRGDDVEARHPWPEGTYVQGGSKGLVIKHEGGTYRTAFVEAFPREPDTFLRGEGATVEEAEDACWAKWERIVACPAHPEHGPFEPRMYRNGAGFCTRCGAWFPKVLPEDEPPVTLGEAVGHAMTHHMDALVEFAEDLEENRGGDGASFVASSEAGSNETGV